MTPDEIRRLYEAERPATDQEAAEDRAEALRDPAMARRLITTLAALASEDPAIAALTNAFMGATVMLLIEERAAHDDAIALHCSALIFQMMDRLGQVRPPAPKTLRGKPEKARTA